MKKLMAYLGSGDITEKDILKLTHMNIAFGHLHSDGTVSGQEHDKVKRIGEFRTWNPKIKILLSLVPGEPDAFTVCCRSEQMRKVAAANIAKAVIDMDLDGIDLDWEYPCVPSNGSDTTPSDKHLFTLLCAAIREKLDRIEGKKYLFSIAAGADLYYVHCVELAELNRYLDYICLMTYDLKCGFHALAGHHTSLYSKTGDVFMNSCDQALRLFHEHGIPKEKLLMGAAFYSRKWTELADRNHGLLQISKQGGGYGPDYDLLLETCIDKNGYTKYWDEEACAPYLFNGSTFISYDDEASLKLKADYILREGYAGIFYWEHKCDKTGILLESIYQELNKGD